MPTHPFHTLDAVVVVVYLGITFLVGVLAHRFWRSSPASDEEYYLAGRRVPAWVNGISYAATAINADVAPLYCGLAAVIGLPVAWYYLSRFSLAWLIVAMLFAARWRQLGIRTGPEFYALRFGGRGARFVRVYTALFTVAINIIPWIGAGLLGTHKILAPVMGYELKDRTLLFVAPLVAIYVWVSGYAGVLATDVFQAFVIIAASLVLMVVFSNRERMRRFSLSQPMSRSMMLRRRYASRSKSTSRASRSWFCLEGITGVTPRSSKYSSIQSA
ncbi:MAG: hypothetical protein U0805_18065 [Pirellulales bacterium]